MLIVFAKSAAALVLGGAVFGQQGNQPNRDVAPPAPSVQPTPADGAQRADRTIPSQDNQRHVIDNSRQTFQTPQGSQHDQQGRAALGVTLSDDLRITQVTPGSPAEQMGLRAGDEVLSLNGQSFNSVDQFIDAVGATPKGQQVRIEVDRNGRQMTQSGTLGPWDRIYYSGSQMAGMAPQGQGFQTHSAMRYPSDGSVAQGPPMTNDQFAGDACCDPCAGSGGGWGGSGYNNSGYGGYGYGGWGGRGSRRAARWGGSSW
ncbi:MAG TPA: PDZ domain-containing protein [Caulifigura sp.]|nr:PDZ domain-containing protein [Caulifigura sp.]